MTFLRGVRDRMVLSAALIAMGMILIPASAQAQCNGGSCPIAKGSSLRTMVGGGFIIPQVPEADVFGAPTGQMDWGNLADGAILPRLGGSPHINVPGGQVTGPNTPRSFTIPLGQLSYGSAPSTPATTPTYYTTPTLVHESNI
jgi:hypothetical protein